MNQLKYFKWHYHQKLQEITNSNGFDLLFNEISPNYYSKPKELIRKCSFCRQSFSILYLRRWFYQIFLCRHCQLIWDQLLDFSFEILAFTKARHRKIKARHRKIIHKEDVLKAIKMSQYDLLIQWMYPSIQKISIHQLKKACNYTKISIESVILLRDQINHDLTKWRKKKIHP